MILEHFTTHRLSNPERLEELLPLFLQYRRFYGLPDEAEASRRYLTDRLTKGDTLLLGAESSVRGSLVGFCHLFYSFSSLKLAPFLVLNDLFVEPDVRSQGIGRLLVEAAKEASLEVGACGFMLDTARENHTAQALYEASGLEANQGSKYYYWYREGLYAG